MSRLTPLSAETMPEEQRKVYEDIAANQRGGVRGPFNAWVRSPELAARLRGLIDFLSHRTSLPGSVRELAVLMVVREWKADYAWKAHEALALQSGLPAEAVAAVAAGRRPGALGPAEAAVYDLVEGLLARREAEEAAYRAAVFHLGEKGVAELTALIGFYVMVSAAVRVFDI